MISKSPTQKANDLMGTHWEKKKKKNPHPPTHLPPQLGLIRIPPLSISWGVLINWSADEKGSFFYFFSFSFWAFGKSLYTV